MGTRLPKLASRGALSPQIQNFVYGAIRLVDCRVGIGIRRGIGVGDRDTAKRLPCDDVGWLASLKPEQIRQRVILIGVSMWPTVDGDGENVVRRVEATIAQNTRQLLADAALDGLELCG
jgi:hypothetical protein